MKRSILCAVLACTLATSVCPLSVAATSAESEPIYFSNQEMGKRLIKNRGWPWTAIEKTVINRYDDANVPQSIYYTEYIDGKWYGGTLDLIGDVRKPKSGPGWEATYTGKINY